MTAANKDQARVQRTGECCTQQESKQKGTNEIIRSKRERILATDSKETKHWQLQTPLPLSKVKKERGKRELPRTGDGQSFTPRTA